MPTDMYQQMVNMHYASTREKMAAKLASLGQSPISESPRSGDECLCEPDCPECGGSGYLRYDVPTDHPQFGKLQPCQNYRIKTLQTADVSKFGLESADLELDWSYVKSRIRHLRLEGVKAVQAVLPKFKQGHGMVALLGTYGQGKTLVEKILTVQAIKTGKTAAYANMSKILDHIRLAFDEEKNMNQELLRRMEFWNGLDMLCIDELDRVNGTEWALDRMFQLLDQRHARAVRGKALTVVASNKATDELDGYLVSRLKDNRLGPVVYLNGDDARAVMPESWQH